MTTLIAETITELFTGAVDMAIRDGQRVSPRSMPTREVLDVELRLRRPRARLLHLPPARVLNPAYAVAEAVWILSGSDEAWIYQYNDRLRQFADDGVLRGAYGPRMRRWGGGVDQLAMAVGLLRRDPDSRRAVVQLYDPARDAAGHSDVPCTTGYRFNLRDGRLHMSTSMRAQDAWTGLPYDVFSNTVLHELVAGWLGAEVGEYRHHVGSLHVYERDLPAADRLLDAERPMATEMESLAVPWDGFDGLLAAVRAGKRTGYPGWDAVGMTMSSYRLWKRGERDAAHRAAEEVDGTLGPALRAWYEHLLRRSGRVPAAAGER
ncbi:thymidylate synthase [Allostreptomyces psammosilenae]|uniref:thymidylate synthase n=1 Tax=Allostreptomyces psammosilenae TaxID=1892865 RepID=A0A852ZT85_9ACTN|nr:thymidylate synthase [Allostreptomyces psammosilenae]NYI05549.1 thymidylate synthase [Allostreptomyces psammosilenae]